MKTLLILVTVFAAAASANGPGRSHDSNEVNSSEDRSGSEGEWGYGDTNGPDTWPDTYPTCGGAKQSPVALETSEAINDATFEPFQFTNYDVLPSAMTVENTGHSAQVGAFNLQASVSGGNLPDKYIFDQFHFHWGAVFTRGSEHTVDGKRYAGELHLVHYRERYGNTSEAANHDQGVAVLGVMLDLSAFNNPALEPIVSSLESIPNPGDEASLDVFALEDILPDKTGHFFRYDGSFTTPECNEAVIWTVFQEPINISSDQLEEFRDLFGPDGNPLQDNFRTLQPLNGRQVYLAQLT